MTSEQTETVICTIPFDGFYYSFHSDSLDHTLEQYFSDDRGDPLGDLVERALDAMDWRKAHNLYAQEYARQLALDCNAQWEFHDLVSPRFYNYSTDEIEVKITRAELQRIYDECDKQALRSLVEDKLKPRSGFIPFYSNDLSDWGDLAEWEAAQLSVLLESYCNEYCSREDRSMIPDDCNGDITRIIEEAIPSGILQQLNDEHMLLLGDV